MAKLRSIAMLMALGLSGASWAAQTPAPTDAADAPAPVGMSDKDPRIVGLEVQSPSGQSLGAVIDVTVDAQRMPEYAIISTGSDTITAVPYKIVVSMIKGNKVLFDRTKLQNSPQVAQSELHDKANTKWRADADTYWSMKSAPPLLVPAVRKPAPQDR